MTQPSTAIRIRAYNLYLEGKGYRAVAKELGLAESSVRDWFRRFRAGKKAYESLLSDTSNSKRYPKELQQEALRLREQGLSWTQIMQKTGVPISTIKNWGRKKKLNATLKT